MDFRLDAAQAAFQEEVQRFIETEVPKDRRAPGPNGGDPALESVVRKKLADRHWLALPWPKEYGGMGASPVQQLIFNELMSYHSVPGFFNMGVMWVGPVVMLYGSEDQKKDYLTGIAEGRQVWCTLYSEPASGSDLASMQTRAQRDGDEYVINGQKIWTSLGHVSDWGWLCARTDPNAPKHKGLSTFAIRMDSPGLSVRPLVNMSGAHEFNEVFFDNVRVPASQLIGEENRGWYNVAVGLDYERSSIGATSTARRTVDELARLMREKKGAVTPELRHRVAELAIATQVLRNVAYNVASVQEATGLAPTRESQMAKLFGAELNQKLQAAALQIFGMEGQAAAAGSEAAGYHYHFLRAVANTIEGGTSEIQRGVIAQRGLGLPRE